MIGGTGLLGSAAAAELIARGHQVKSIALPPLPEGAPIPEEMEIVLGNYLTMSDDELREKMAGCDCFIFAAGVDERVEFPAPVYAAYEKYNIRPVKRLLGIAKACGVKNCVVLGSYFAYFAKEHPEMNLCVKHPYIRSRIAQEQSALSFADDEMSVCVLELPYIFGTQPGRKPVWVILIEQLEGMGKITMYPKGGTTMVTVRQVGQAIAGAAERNRGANCYPIGYYNLTWNDFLKIVHKAMGQPNRKIINMNPYFSTSQISNLTLTDTMTDTSIPITMPFARPLEQVFESNMELSTTVLLQSSESASVIPYGISDEQLENWTPEEYGPFPLAILSEKSFEDGKSSRVAAFGSAVSLSDSLLSSGSFCNSDYYLSVLNTLTHRENIISIQSKTLGGQELGLNTAQVFLIGSGFMIVLPIVTLCCGLYLWLKRKNA